jgi:hypothetical protein
LRFHPFRKREIQYLCAGRVIAVKMSFIPAVKNDIAGLGSETPPISRLLVSA